MTTAWTPLLDDQPEIAGVLLSSLRQVLPGLFDAALQTPEHDSKPVSAALGMPDDPSARISVVGRDLRREGYGERDALYLQFSGEARVGNGVLRVAGDAVLDLATDAILRLRLSEPVAA